MTDGKPHVSAYRSGLRQDRGKERGFARRRAFRRGARALEAYGAVLNEGLRTLEQLGLTLTGKFVRVAPAQLFGDYARQIGTDRVVVGHRKRSLLERWWSGTNRAYIVDNLDFSLLVARSDICNEAFAVELSQAAWAG